MTCSFCRPQSQLPLASQLCRRLPAEGGVGGGPATPGNPGSTRVVAKRNVPHMYISMSIYIYVYIHVYIYLSTCVHIYIHTYYKLQCNIGRYDICIEQVYM